MNSIKLLIKHRRNIKSTYEFDKKKRLTDYLNRMLGKPIFKKILRIYDEDHLENFDEGTLITMSILKYSLFARQTRRNSQYSFKHVCKLTGRPRGLVSKIYLSRMVFKQLTNLGVIPGVRRASW